MSAFITGEKPSNSRWNQKTITISSTAPLNPQDGQEWLDTSVSPYQVKKYHSALAAWKLIEIPVKKVKMPAAVASDYATPPGITVVSSNGSPALFEDWESYAVGQQQPGSWTIVREGTNVDGQTVSSPVYEGVRAYKFTCATGGGSPHDATLKKAVTFDATAENFRYKIRGTWTGGDGWSKVIGMVVVFIEGGTRWSIFYRNKQFNNTTFKGHRDDSGAHVVNDVKIDVDNIAVANTWYETSRNLKTDYLNNRGGTPSWSNVTGIEIQPYVYWDTNGGNSGEFVYDLIEYGNNAAKAKDDNTATFWQPSPTNEASAWIYFDLGSVLLVSGCRIYWLAASEIPGSFNIDVSEDAVAWNNVKQITTAQTPNAWNEYSWNTRRARYVRVQVVSYGSSSTVKVAEFDYYSTVIDKALSDHGHGDV